MAVTVTLIQYSTIYDYKVQSCDTLLAGQKKNQQLNHSNQKLIEDNIER